MREPAAAGAEIGDDRAVGDLQRVHDQIGLLPLIAIGRFEQPEILGGNSRSWVFCCRRAGGAGAGGTGAAEGRRAGGRVRKWTESREWRETDHEMPTIASGFMACTVLSA